MPRIADLKPERVPAGSKPILDVSAGNIGFTPNMTAAVALSPIAFNALATPPRSLRRAPGSNPSRQGGSRSGLFGRGYGIRRFQPHSSYRCPVEGLDKPGRRRVTSVTRSHIAVIIGQCPEAIDSGGRERGVTAASCTTRSGKFFFFVPRAGGD